MLGPGDPYATEFTAWDPTTMGLANTDALPVATASRNGVDDPAFVLTVTFLSLGRYSITGVIPAFYEVDDTINVSWVGAVGGTIIGNMIDTLTLEGASGSLPTPATPGPVPQAPISGGLSVVYCADEHIAIRAGIDFVSLIPQSQLLAAAPDGVFAGADLWTLVSPTTAFESQSVVPGCVVWLQKPQSAFPQAGQLLAVDSVSGNSCRLRRLGMTTGQGLPPAPPGGVASVTFSICTYAPQIEEESFALNQLLSIDPAYPGRMPKDIYDLRPLRRACVLRVLLDRYTIASQGGSGDYAVKIDQCRFELGEVMAALTLRWGTSPTAPQTTNRFSTRIVR